MVDFKRKKEVKQKENPSGKFIAQGGSPERYYSENPARAFLDEIRSSLQIEKFIRFDAANTVTKYVRLGFYLQKLSAAVSSL